jgi:DNA repair protein RadC
MAGAGDSHSERDKGAAAGAAGPSRWMGESTGSGSRVFLLCAAEGDTVQAAWEQAVSDVAAATRPESVRGNSFLSENPRERLLRLGAAALTDSELLSLLFSGGSRTNPVLGLAESLLLTGGGLKALFQKEPQELAQQAGLGPARASRMMAALELGRRVQKSSEVRPRLQTPQQIYSYLAPALSALRRETFHALCLNARGFLLRDVRVGEGSADCCIVDPREVFSAAVIARATGLIVAHNHPTGDPEPSAHDIALTRQLMDAGRVLNIRVMDHLIVGDDCYFSFSQRGRLPAPRSLADESASFGDEAPPG